MAKKPASEDWHWADILAAIKKSRFRTMEALAKHHGLKSYSGIRDCESKPYAAAERRIAAAIGVRPEVIWPSRWHPDGTRKTRAEMAAWKSAQKSTQAVPAHNVNITQIEVT